MIEISLLHSGHSKVDILSIDRETYLVKIDIMSLIPN